MLGPLLFLVYINDLERAVGNEGLNIYADDTLLFTTDVSIGVAATALNVKLQKADLWCKVNKLTMNTNKTKLVVFSQKYNKRGDGAGERGPRITLGESVLEVKPSYNYLGVILDQKLNYDAHINSVIKRVNNKLWFFSKMQAYMSPFIAKRRLQRKLLRTSITETLFMLEGALPSWRSSKDYKTGH